MNSKNLKIVKKYWRKKHERFCANGRNMHIVVYWKWNILMHRRIQPFLHQFQALSQAHKCHYKCIQGKVDGKRYRFESATERVKTENHNFFVLHKKETKERMRKMQIDSDIKQKHWFEFE